MEKIQEEHAYTIVRGRIKGTTRWFIGHIHLPGGGYIYIILLVADATLAGPASIPISL